MSFTAACACVPVPCHFVSPGHPCSTRRTHEHGHRRARTKSGGAFHTGNIPARTRSRAPPRCTFPRRSTHPWLCTPAAPRCGGPAQPWVQGRPLPGQWLTAGTAPADPAGAGWGKPEKTRVRTNCPPAAEGVKPRARRGSAELSLNGNHVQTLQSVSIFFFNFRCHYTLKKKPSVSHSKRRSCQICSSPSTPPEAFNEPEPHWRCPHTGGSCWE